MAQRVQRHIWVNWSAPHYCSGLCYRPSSRLSASPLPAPGGGARRGAQNAGTWRREHGTRVSPRRARYENWRVRWAAGAPAGGGSIGAYYSRTCQDVLHTCEYDRDSIPNFVRASRSRDLRVAENPRSPARAVVRCRLLAPVVAAAAAARGCCLCHCSACNHRCCATSFARDAARCAPLLVGDNRRGREAAVQRTSVQQRG